MADLSINSVLVSAVKGDALNQDFDVSKAYEHLKTLASMRRLPGTPGEREARSYILRVCREMGLETVEEEFCYSRKPLTLFLPLICFGLGTISLCGSILFKLFTPWMIVPGFMLLFFIYMGFKWASAFEYFARKGGSEKSANIIAVAKSKKSVGSVMVSAHYDSKSQLMPVALRAALFVVGFISALLFSLALVIIGFLGASGRNITINIPYFAVSLVPAICFFVLVFNFTSNKSTGALDNASGEAVILEVGRVLSDSPLENLDLIIASFGCEEVGLVGSIKYLIAHEEELKKSPFFMLNFDMPFSPDGKLYLNTGFEIPPRRTSSKLNELARSVAGKMGISFHNLFMPVGAAADHMPWVKHFFEATGFVSPTTYVHSRRDSISKINTDALEKIGKITLGILRELDGGYSEGQE